MTDAHHLFERPTWRGRIHTWAFAAAIPAGIYLIVMSHAAEARVAASIYAASLDAAGLARFEALKELRNELRDGKPAYVVFDNKTLVAIARTVPSTLTELSRISGVGPAKLERYGEAVIALLAKPA